jgi:hypothetical protein
MNPQHPTRLVDVYGGALDLVNALHHLLRQLPDVAIGCKQKKGSSAFNGGGGGRRQFVAPRPAAASAVDHGAEVHGWELMSELSHGVLAKAA